MTPARKEDCNPHVEHSSWLNYDTVPAFLTGSPSWGNSAKKLGLTLHVSDGVLWTITNWIIQHIKLLSVRLILLQHASIGSDN